MARGDRPPGRRSQSESERTRARILSRAERLFAGRGYRGVTVRDIAEASGVRPYTIQHHFGSKLGLYEAVLCRWDEEVLERVSRRLDTETDFATLVEDVVDELFDFFLTKRDWVAVTSRATLGEGIDGEIALQDRSWVEFITEGMEARHVGAAKLDPRLLLITIEGMLYNHVLAETHYRQLFGRDVTDPELKLRTKQHLKRVLLALLGDEVEQPSPIEPAKKRD